MALRLTAQAGRILMSKPGFDVSASMPDEQKLFDSNWFATGMIMAMGTAQKTAGQQLVIPFPFTLHYVPAVDVMLNANYPAAATVTTSAIIVDATVAAGTLHYTVWAISG